MAVVEGSSNVLQLNNNDKAKFSEHRTQVMLGDLPSDFLRLQFVEPYLHNSSMNSHEFSHNPDFLGCLTLTIAEAKLIKNAGPLGLIRMDPYVRFQFGHIIHETPTAIGGGKNPQWKISYRINLFRGMKRLHMEVYDQRNFTEDIFIGECDITIPNEVFNGQTYQHWYSLMGRDANVNENQGEIHIIMSLGIMVSDIPPAVEGTGLMGSGNISSSSSTNSLSEVVGIYSEEDLRTVEEMFPNIDRQVIIHLLEKYEGNKSLAVNELLQSNHE